MDSLDFNGRLADAARAMSGSRDSGETLQQIAEAAVDLIGPCDIAGVCVLRDGEHDSCAHTHSHLQPLDDLQRELGEGPSVSTLTTRDVIYVPDLTDRDPWPAWGPAAAERSGMRSYLGYRLFTDTSSVGTLNLYASGPDAFSAQDRLDAMVLAAHAAVALSSTVRHEQMHTALSSRQLIGEATGILRARFDLTSEQAFNVLKRISSHHNVKLFSVAEHVVSTGSLPPEA
ncbi:GAF and ANTAR domain-containing protein [Nocardioides zeicaulis]|uniref:ANTAR domain-containing protein n=1 Tax=Nocardioides zeicaulis TaxID=1776857 RepID=A0ABV6E4R1_9ACTN